MFIVTQIFDEPEDDKENRQARQIVSVLLRFTYYAFQLSVIYESAYIIYFEMGRILFSIYFTFLYFFLLKSFYLSIRCKSYTYENMIEEQNLCKRCKIHREITTHHCKICQTCVLEMDHHCFFIGNCVGKNNYKYFISFICYTNILTLSVLLYLGQQFYFLVTFKFGLLTVHWFRLIFVYIFTILLFFSAISMLIAQIYVLANNSSIVHMRKYPDLKKYTYCQFILSIFKKSLYTDIYNSWNQRSEQYYLLIP
ncbi:unnamed protein product [Paramecium primaurelia]|uniref:Palmitoyltransferase n=1 Tax=Paramecium primaurelia TaxID=5886 RepID=A0A8S1K696_PARPR|nr:unnamed protein product [Paramecium primaurelia]